MGLMELAHVESDNGIVEFDEEQLKQVTYVLEAGIDSIILQHPEWSPMFMNYVWNREKEGKRDVAVRVVNWINDNNVRYSDKYKVDVTWETASQLFGIAETNPEFMGMIKIARDKDGTFNKCLQNFYIIETSLILRNALTILASGRAVINSLDWGEDSIIFSEGIQEVHDMIRALKSAFDKEAHFGDDGYSCLLSLDDMNIRGQQILYALEYAGGSVSNLAKVLRNGRSTEFVDYVNSKSANQYYIDRQAKQLAVTSGASFDKIEYMDRYTARYGDYSIREDNYEEYIKDVSSLTVDWSSIDIHDNVTLNDALKIMEAHGFKVVRRVANVSSSGTATECVLWYNPEYGIQAKAGNADAMNVVYGGMDMVVFSRDRMRTDCTSGFIDELTACGHGAFYHVLTHHDGLFRYWDMCTECACKLSSEEWGYVPITAWNIQLPEYVDLFGVYNCDRTLYHMYGDQVSSHVSDWINVIVTRFDDKIDSVASDLFAGIKGDDWINYAVSHNYSMYYCDADYFLCLGLALRVLNAPEDIRKRFYDACHIKCEERTAKIKERNPREECRELLTLERNVKEFLYGYDTDSELIEYMTKEGRKIPVIDWSAGTVTIDSDVQ